MRRKRHTARCRRQRTGAITVEFALTASLLFFFVFTQWELCRVNMIRHTADAAAYEAARRGIVPGATAEDVQEVANSMLATATATDATVTVEPSVIGDDTPEIVVTVAIPMDSNGWVVPRFFGGRTITKSCRLQREKLNP